MKTRLVCVKAFETIIPAARIILQTPAGTIETDSMLPESRFAYHVGKQTTARNNSELHAMLSTGNWEIAP